MEQRDCPDRHATGVSQQSSFNGRLKTLVESSFIELYSTPASIEVAVHFIALNADTDWGCIELRQAAQAASNGRPDAF
jgi:hypothetical protein